MKIIQYDANGKQIETDSRSLDSPTSSGSALAPAPRRESVRPKVAASDGVELYLFQTGTLRTKRKLIAMNQGEENFEIPVPWYLLKHPMGNVVIDGGNAIEVAVDKRAHWGSVVDVYEPVMELSDDCVEQCRSVGVEPEDVRYVLQSHLHLDHTGAIGRFPRAQHIVQRVEYDYAFKPHWFSAPAYIRADFDRPGLRWKFLGGETTDFFDLFGDDVIKAIFTPGHSPGHQSFLVTLPNTGPILLAIDAAYTVDHWNNKALPGLVVSSADAADSVAKLHRVAEKTGAMVITGHDPVQWEDWRKAPSSFYT